MIEVNESPIRRIESSVFSIVAYSYTIHAFIIRSRLRFLLFGFRFFFFFLLRMFINTLTVAPVDQHDLAFQLIQFSYVLFYFQYYSTCR